MSLSVLGMAVWFTQVKTVDGEAQYQPREFNQRTSQEGFDYLHKIQANQITGVIDPADVIAEKVVLCFFANLIEAIVAIPTPTG